MSDLKQPKQLLNLQYNKAVRIITATVSTILAIAGIDHGFFEILQGFKKTPGLIIQAIGADIRWWQSGSEEAFSIIPNFLITGILAVSISIFIIVWSIGFVHKKHGRKVLLLLCILLFLFGGGIAAQILFFLPVCAYATRIDKPLNLWKKVLPGWLRPGLAKAWKYLLTAACILFFIGLEIAIFGYFPVRMAPEILLYTCWGFLFASLILINLSYISGFAYDIERKPNI
jgi:hypothetical protein